VLGANYIQSHILHFYHLAALDFVKGPGVAPFVPRYEGDYRLPEDVNAKCVEHYLEALDMRMKAQEMLAIFGGKMPCHVTFCPGGITETPTVDKIASFLWRLRKLIDFIDNTYIPDVLAVAGAYKDYTEIGEGCGTLLSYGVFDLDNTGKNKLLARGVANKKLELKEFDPAKITEHVKFSWYDVEDGLNPKEGETVPDLKKKRAYSWLKSPRYDNMVCEVGPLARMVVTYLTGNKKVQELVNGALEKLNAPITALFSVAGRHAARALECSYIAHAMEGWLLELKPGEPTYTECEVPLEGEGMGLTEAPRGALGHWISIKDHKIARYQVITPTNWNASPRDHKRRRGPIEHALIGTPVRDIYNPFEVVRVVRSFDPCIACAVHVGEVNGEGREFIIS
jgi:hydrogenase large subunit